MRLKGKTQINVQVDDEMVEDIKIVAHRRGQTMSEFIRRIILKELENEADRNVVIVGAE